MKPICLTASVRTVAHHIGPQITPAQTEFIDVRID